MTCTCRQRRCLLCDVMLACGEHLPEKQFCEVRGAVSKEVFRPHKVLFRQGHPADHLFILKHGYVKLSTSLPDGRSQGLRLAPPWSVLGIEALGMTSYPCSAEAVTEVQVCTFRHGDMLRALDSNHELSRRLVHMINSELRHSMAQVRNIGVLSAEEKVCWFLLNTAEDGSGPPVSRADIAEVLGMTVETVSRVLSRLKRLGIVDAPSYRRAIRILDPHQLLALSGEAAAASCPLDCA